MTLLQLRDQIRKRLGDKTSAFWSNDELNQYINDGCRDLSFRTKSIVTNGYITTVSCDENLSSSKSNEYVLSTNFSNIYSVLRAYYFENEMWTRLEPARREELDEEQPSWRGNVGYTKWNGILGDWDTSTTYTQGDLVLYGGSTWESLQQNNQGNTPASGAWWQVSSLYVEYNKNSKTSTPTHYYWSRVEDIIGIDPPPGDDEAGTNYLRVYYSKMHEDMTSDSEEPQIPEPLHLAVINYAVAVGSEDRGWGDKANDNWTKYYARIKDYKVETNREREDDEIMSMNYKGL
jgi:hypothetical protein